MKHRLITKLVIFGFAAIFLLGMASESTAQNATVQKGKPPKDSVQDLPVCAYFNAGHLGTATVPLCDSSRGISAYVGRNFNIKVAIRKNLSNPYFSLDLTNPLDWIEGDPIPVAGLPLPTLGSDPRISEPDLQAGVEVLLIDLTTTIGTNARLYFKDDNGVLYLLHWGPIEFPGHNQRTNPDAPFVWVTGYTDDDGKRNWSVETLAETDGVRSGIHTSFLWVSVSGPWEYVGAYNVSFSYNAIEE
jgi:hypothetical protein